MIVPLHNHSEYSALDGLATMDEIARRCVDLGCPCCGITDHGTVAGHLEAAKVFAKYDIKPIFGCEFYLGTKTEFEPHERDQHHYIAGALTDEGLRNIWRMVDAASDPANYRFVGRLNLDICRKFSEGVFATSACIQGIIGQCFLKEDKGDPHWWLNQFLDIYGENFFIELHTYPGEEHERLNQYLVEMASERGIGMVYATDAHFAFPEQYDTHDAYVAMSTGENIYLDPADRKMWHPKSLYIQSEEGIRSSLAYLPERVVDEAIANTVMIGEKADAHLPEVRRHLPTFIPGDCPWLQKDRRSAAELLLDLVQEGIQARYGDAEEAWERAGRELEVFLDAGLEHYFLQAWDFCQFCDQNAIQRGPGRGSAAGAIVAYALGITDVDPLHYGLIFERFYNPGRAKGFPDIDNDFPKANRKQVRQYLKDRWGRDKVRTIGTVTRLKPKAAIDKTYKVCLISWDEKETLKRIVEETPDIEILGSDSIGWSQDTDPGKTIYVMETVGKDILDWVEAQPANRWDVLMRWLDLLEVVCSRVSGYGVHPSGVVVSDVSLADELPCMYNRSQEEQVTCFAMDDVDKRQFVKQDLLGLRNLDTVQDWEAQLGSIYASADEETKRDLREKMSVLDVVAEKAGFKWSGLDKEEHPEDMWRMLEDGFTRGIFQIEDGYAARLVKDFKPRSVEDLSIIVALNRPGPIRSGAPDSFIARRRGDEEVAFDHPMLEERLESTYGWFLYQEQIIFFFGDLGYDPSDADAVRKMLGKKSPEAMQALIHGKEEWEGKGYMQVAQEHMDEATAKVIIDKIADFAKYSFNKAHSVCYAVIAFRTLYAKYYYPAEFLMASIRTIGDDPAAAKKTAGYIGEARRMGIEVLPPDIMESQPDIAVVGGHIYFGFTQIKGIKSKATSLFILKLREKYDVTSPEKLTDAIDTEDTMWREERDEAKASGRAFRKKSPKQILRSNQVEALFQAGAFDNWGEREVGLVEKQRLEKELLGVILTDDSDAAFDRNSDLIGQYLPCSPIDGYEALQYPEPGLVVAMPGVISQVVPKTTKRDGKPMGIVTIEYQGHEAEFAVFPQSWRSHRFLWKERTPGCFTLKCTDRGVHFEDGIRLD